MRLKLFFILFITIILIISLVSLILPVAIVENAVSQDKTSIYEPGAFLNYTISGGSFFIYKSNDMCLWPKYLMLETLNNGAFVIHVSFRVFNTNYPSNAYDNNYSYNLPQQDNALFSGLFTRNGSVSQGEIVSLGGTTGAVSNGGTHTWFCWNGEANGPIEVSPYTIENTQSNIQIINSKDSSIVLCNSLTGHENNAQNKILIELFGGNSTLHPSTFSYVFFYLNKTNIGITSIVYSHYLDQYIPVDIVMWVISGSFLFLLVGRVKARRKLSGNRNGSKDSIKRNEKRMRRKNL